MKRIHFVVCALILGLSLFSCSSCRKIPGGGPGSTTTIEKGDNLANITYQLNVYSFADSDGDGWGDLKGVTQHLDYFESLGVSALWLSPIQACGSYHGYDVSDYNAINPKLGTEADFKDLIDQARAKGIDIYMDYVLNHSGDQNPWFRQACADPAGPYRNYYVFSDDPNADMRAGKVDNFAGATSTRMGTWHPLSGAVGGRLHFKWDYSARTVTVTRTEEAAQKPNTEATRWLYYGDNVLAGLYQTSANVFEITVDFNSSWGFLLRTSATSWDGGTKWGGNGKGLTLGTPYAVNNTNPQDITFAGGSYYFASFDRSMPDLNYGPYDKVAESPAFKDLAASADKWINLGVNGLRLDAVVWIYQEQTAANVAFLKAWYDRCNTAYKARGGAGDLYMVGEAWCDNAEQMAPYYQGLPSNFNFYYYWTLKDRINRGRGDDFARTVSYFRGLFRQNRAGFIDAIKLTNHDEDRAASDLGRDVNKEKLAAAVLLTSPGKPFVYQGEELGYWGTKSRGDEYVRTPMKWTRSGNVPAGALGGKVDNAMLSPEISVEAQTADPASLLNVYRKFAEARNTYKALARGEISEVASSNGAVALWKMTADGQTVLVAHNFGSSVATVSPSGISALSKDAILVSNGVVSVNGTSITLAPYASAVFAQ